MRVLVADPPWRFSDKLPGKKRGAQRHYRCMSVDEICAMQLPELGADAVLFLWRVESMPEEAYRVVRAWGFVPKSALIWLKQTKRGRPHFGMGRYVRAAHESCVIAARGRAMPLVHDIRSIFEAPTGVHSQKPDAFYRIVEQLYPHAEMKYELFARTIRPGWAQLGDELGSLEAAQ